MGKLPRVVVCKWVRKPGVDEVYSHPIVVNANALVGKGFDGTFPFPFSDGQVNSVAIRYAEPGESAREVGATDCPATSEVPPGGEPGGEDPGDGDEVGGVSETDDEIAAVAGVSDVAPGAAADGAAVRAAVDARSGWLPATGLDEHLQLAALAGGLVTLLGGALVAVAARRRRTA
ncbi:LPXTG cell wall anchor domain-containing protein [Nocardioides sp. SYSU DS0651]|uniref:LPXTG cell wall anchor domain-containing protein n=1 Tax=Nocardioides sp. SYSU DS0651 TaxID=3415955 RepID=UPI003F4B115D